MLDAESAVLGTATVFGAGALALPTLFTLPALSSLGLPTVPPAVLPSLILTADAPLALILEPELTGLLEFCFGSTTSGINLSAGYSGTDLNSQNTSHCSIGNNYSIPCDANENSVLTGEKDKFTCSDIEVYAVKY